MAKDPVPFKREELKQTEKRAMIMADAVSNPSWKRAYQDLAHACNVLDAFIARSTVKD